MSNNDPEQIRRDIEQTRANLSNDVNALADEAKPSNMARRQGEKIKDSARGLKDKIMGSDDTDRRFYGDSRGMGDREYELRGTGRDMRDMRDNAQDRLNEAGDRIGAASQDARDAVVSAGQDARDAVVSAGQDARDAVQKAPRQMRRQTQGNPLAAGLIAFGVGALVGGMLPASQAERRAAVELKDRAQPAVEHAQGVAQEVAQNLKAPAQEAVENVKQSATESVQNVKETGQGHAEDLKDHAQQAKDDVQDHNS